MIAKLFERRAETLNPRHPGDPALASLFGLGRRTDAGVEVTHDVAVSSSAVFGAARVLAETLASVPWVVNRRLERGKERDPRHRLYRVLHDRPNPEMTSAVFRETLMYHGALAGNALGSIVRSTAGDVLELWPLLTDRTWPVRSERTGRLFFATRLKNGEVRLLAKDDVFHVPGVGSSGVWGSHIVELAKDSIGLSIAAQKFGALFFGQGASPSGTLKHPKELSDPAYKRLKESIRDAQEGLDAAHRFMILEEGMEWQQVGLSPEHAQFLETRKFQVRDVARWFRMQPHLLQDLENATFTNVESQSREFVQYTMLPWFVKWEQESQSLFRESEREGHFAAFVIEGLLRGDIQARGDFYVKMVQNAVLSPNEVRELEDRNPREGGDLFLMPINMMPVGSDGLPAFDSPGTGSPAADPEDRAARFRERRAVQAATHRRRLAHAQQPVFAAAAERVLRAARRDLVKQARKGPARADAASFQVFLEDFYREGGPHAAYAEAQFLPAFRSLGDGVLGSVADETGSEVEASAIDTLLAGMVTAFVSSYSARSRAALQDLAGEVGEAELASSLEARFDDWEKTEPGQIARRETIGTASAVARRALDAAGVRRFRWVAFGSSCPFCTQLDGKIVGRSEAFLSAGDRLEGGEDQEPLQVQHNTFHAPAHGGCDCGVAAA